MAYVSPANSKQPLYKTCEEAQKIVDKKNDERKTTAVTYGLTPVEGGFQLCAYSDD